jgi:ADP-ribose pyrophosphatase
MSRINDIQQVTKNRFLNFYEMDVEGPAGNPFKYYMASREKSIDGLKCKTGKTNSNGVIIYSLYGEQRDRVVLIRQFRYPLGRYVYEFPAGLVEEGEDYREAGVRELYEETGLTLQPLNVPEGYDHPFYNSCGMSDEANATLFGYATGTVNTSHLEATEDLEVVLADKAEAKRILKEEQVAIMCAYMLMHFIASPDGQAFKFLQEL